MTTLFCSTCGEIDSRYHKCNQWEVIDQNDDDWSDCITVFAYDEASAAREASEKMDLQGDGPQERRVCVRRAGTNRHITFYIDFEHSVNYYAWAVPNTDKR